MAWHWVGGIGPNLYFGLHSIKSKSKKPSLKKTLKPLSENIYERPIWIDCRSNDGLPVLCPPLTFISKKGTKNPSFEKLGGALQSTCGKSGQYQLQAADKAVLLSLDLNGTNLTMTWKKENCLKKSLSNISIIIYDNNGDIGFEAAVDVAGKSVRPSMFDGTSFLSNPIIYKKLSNISRVSITLFFKNPGPPIFVWSSF